MAIDFFLCGCHDWSVVFCTLPGISRGVRPSLECKGLCENTGIIISIIFIFPWCILELKRWLAILKHLHFHRSGFGLHVSSQRRPNTGIQPRHSRRRISRVPGAPDNRRCLSTTVWIRPHQLPQCLHTCGHARPLRPYQQPDPQPTVPPAQCPQPATSPGRHYFCHPPAPRQRTCHWPGPPQVSSRAPCRRPHHRRRAARGGGAVCDGAGHI